jgi:hypothetical protein
MAVRQSSATPNDGPWVSWPDEMARKTVVRRLAKRLPVLDQADEALHRTIGRVDSLYAFGTPAPEAPQPPSSPRDALNAQIPLKAAAAAAPRPERKVDPTPYEADPRETDEERWKRNLLAKLALAKSRADVVAVGALKSVHAAQASGIPELAVWVTKALNDAFARFPEEPEAEPGDDLDEVVIEGQEKMAAG